MVDCVGYLSWTFFARRVKENPSYYGADSSSDEDVERFLLEVAKDVLSLLDVESCITIDGNMDETDSGVVPSSLGVAASDYYLTYRTPKQMQFGLTQCAKMMMQDRKNISQGETYGATFQLRPLVRTRNIDELSIAWLLYTISCTHEFDELPVRHNEEILNEELSKVLMWGPDTSKLMSPEVYSSYIDPEIYAQPHTK